MPPLKSPENQALGKAMRELRKEGGFSQEGFAAHAGIDRSYYGQIERGLFNVSVDTIIKIAAGLQIPASEIWRRAGL